MPTWFSRASFKVIILPPPVQFNRKIPSYCVSEWGCGLTYLHLQIPCLINYWTRDYPLTNRTILLADELLGYLDLIARPTIGQRKRIYHRQIHWLWRLLQPLLDFESRRILRQEYPIRQWKPVEIFGLKFIDVCGKIRLWELTDALLWSTNTISRFFNSLFVDLATRFCTSLADLQIPMISVIMSTLES